MTQNEHLAFVADALLALCDRTPAQPHYTEGMMQRKLSVARRRDPIYAHVLANHPHDFLLEEECRDIVEIAKLTDRQSEILQMRLDGYTFEEIGRVRGHTKQGAQRIFVQSLKKLAYAFRVYSFRGMSEVYRAELKRGMRKNGFGTIPIRAA